MCRELVQDVRFFKEIKKQKGSFLFDTLHLRKKHEHETLSGVPEKSVFLMYRKNYWKKNTVEISCQLNTPTAIIAGIFW